MPTVAKDPKTGHVLGGYAPRIYNGDNAGIEDALFNDFDSSFKLEHERPVHRKMISMAAEGYSQTEIAEYTGYSREHVSKVLRQPWAREHMVKQVKKGVMDEMKDFLEAQVMPNLKAIATVRDKANASNRDVLDASNSLLDRFLGKAPVVVKQETVDPTKLPDAALEAEVKKLLEHEPGTEESPAGGVPEPEAPEQPAPLGTSRGGASTGTNGTAPFSDVAETPSRSDEYA